MEYRSLLEEGDTTLTGSKYLWMTKAEKLGDVARETLDLLRGMCLKTARAWAIKEIAMSLWRYVRRGWARRVW